jgi:hypothetical protein
LALSRIVSCVGVGSVTIAGRFMATGAGFGVVERGVESHPPLTRNALDTKMPANAVRS